MDEIKKRIIEEVKALSAESAKMRLHYLLTEQAKRELAKRPNPLFLVRYSKEQNLKVIPGIPFVMTSVPKIPNNSPEMLMLSPEQKAKRLRKMSKYPLEIKLLSVPTANDADAPATTP